MGYSDQKDMIIKIDYEFMYNRLKDNNVKLRKVLHDKIRFLLVVINDIDRYLDDNRSVAYARKCELLGQKLAYYGSIEMLQELLLVMDKLQMWGKT